VNIIKWRPCLHHEETMIMSYMLCH